jgi:hypothetical protein
MMQRADKRQGQVGDDPGNDEQRDDRLKADKQRGDDR